MIDIEVEYGATAEVSAEAIRAQLELLVRDDVFRSSELSVAFLRYVVEQTVVEQTLNGSADQIKERTIGVEVFGRDPSYDTNRDHIVRTVATELRKRLASYYVDEKHRAELRMGLVPGSYIPRFTIPDLARHTHAESVPQLEAAGAHLKHTAHKSHLTRLLCRHPESWPVRPRGQAGVGSRDLHWQARSVLRQLWDTAGYSGPIRKIFSGCLSSIRRVRFF
jgi:hypothetical protein